MSISTVKAVLNGNTYNLTYNSATGKWEAAIPAPIGSSFNRDGGKYNVQLTAVNEAGSSATIDRTDDTFGSVLALKVIEKQVPVIIIVSPGTGAHIASATPTIKFNLFDNSIGSGGDSGIDLSSLILKVDNTAVANDKITCTELEGGYECEFTPDALSDGSHIVIIDVNDNDGNSANQVSVSFTVDTVPPVLNINTPADNLITNEKNLRVSGTTNDVTSTSVNVNISLNGVEQGSVDVDSSGNFSMDIELDAGVNTIVVTATDSAGKSSTVTRTVTLDVSVPVFKSVVLTPNPADAGATLTLAVEVE